MSTLVVDSIQNSSGDNRFGPITGTVVDTSTGASSYDITGIPSWVSKITLTFNGVSLSGTDRVLIQIGDAGGVETTGYTGSRTNTGSTSLTGAAMASTGFEDPLTGAALARYGIAELRLHDATTFTWTCCIRIADGSVNQSYVTGVKSLSAALDRVRLETNGTDTFDAGEINIIYE